MLIVPLNATPSQTVTVQLGGQNCQVNLYAKSTGMFADLYVADVLMLGGVLCLDRNRIVRDAYHGFIGDLAMVDTQGTSDPASDGLGVRFLLVYLEAADL